LALIALCLAAAICYVCFYHVPGMLGMKTGLPLYIVGTSTYGVQGGFLMPGFLMGCLQFGWLSVNGFFAGLLLASLIGFGWGSAVHLGLGIIWAIIAAFVGLKGIKYVGMVASYMPIIPIVVLVILLVTTMGGVGKFDQKVMLDAAEAKKADAVKGLEEFPKPGTLVTAELAKLEGKDTSEVLVTLQTVIGDELTKHGKLTADAEAKPAVTLYGSGLLGVLSLLCAYIVGFFATAGAAGCDFGSNNKNRTAVMMGGLVGIAGATIFTGAIALLVIAGSQGATGVDATVLNPLDSMENLIGGGLAKTFMFLLAIAAFPSACFSSLIAANSFKTTLPKVDPFISCGIGTMVACGLIISGFAGQAGDMFTLIGASFGPVCGAMMADYLLSGKKWAGPRAGFNPAGWISYAAGFLVGGITLFVEVFMGGTMPFEIPCPPVSAFVVGFVLYYALAKAGLESKKLDMPQRIDA
jgi:cytosine permease